MFAKVALKVNSGFTKKCRGGLFDRATKDDVSVVAVRTAQVEEGKGTDRILGIAEGGCQATVGWLRALTWCCSLACEEWR